MKIVAKTNQYIQIPFPANLYLMMMDFALDRVIPGNTVGTNTCTDFDISQYAVDRPLLKIEYFLTGARYCEMYLGYIRTLARDF